MFESVMAAIWSWGRIWYARSWGWTWSRRMHMSTDPSVLSTSTMNARVGAGGHVHMALPTVRTRHVYSKEPAQSQTQRSWPPRSSPHKSQIQCRCPPGSNVAALPDPMSLSSRIQCRCPPGSNVVVLPDPMSLSSRIQCRCPPGSNVV